MRMRRPTSEDFAAIQELCRRVYPFSKPWSIAQLEAHQVYFPDGQLVVEDEESGKLVGMAFSLIISWDDYSPQDSWQDFTSGGFFHNHNPRKGKTLYGAEVMVDPEFRGRGIGKMLYEGRRQIAERYGLKRIRAGARLRGYSKFADRLTPTEYTQAVVRKEIYDPTLSFQLGGGFVVLDVAKNYLFNDPESLGYAAVIEWLNPGACTDRDRKRQKDSVDAFMSSQRLAIEHLPKELRRLVRKMTLLLGEVIREYEGDAFLDQVEGYRQKLKRTRTSHDPAILRDLMAKLEKQSSLNRFKIAHAFALLLELVNTCESSYRTWRLRQKTAYSALASKTELRFVLTAHPTEARSRVVVELTRQLVYLLVDGLQNNFSFREAEIKVQLRLLWLRPLVKTKAPTVTGEAEYIYSQIFARPIFDFLLEPKHGYDLRLRTWVGGDKDGHPGVNEAVMTKCLSGSRQHVCDAIEHKLNAVMSDLEKLKDLSSTRSEEIGRFKGLLSTLADLRDLRHGDGRRVRLWLAQYNRLLGKASRFVVQHHQILLINRLLELFPALVLPIELRESSDLIERALSDTNAPIRKMLAEVVRLCGGHEAIHYVRGLIISHCESAQDMTNANELIWKACHLRKLPVIPLFESRHALRSGRKILSEWLKKPAHLNQVRAQWAGKLEVMLGYSDSAKEAGVLPSRHLIRDSMFEFETAIRGFKLKPQFFHGSGGSVERGGGSIKEQIAWWSNSAIQWPKLTIQGESIQRTFATKEILNSQCMHMSNEARLRRARKAKAEPHPVLSQMIDSVEASYRAFVENADLLNRCLDATPYHYLNVLKIGSRPSKRPSGRASVDSLRAIPWILCWTQTRLLFPTWWGVGSAWQGLSALEKDQLKLLWNQDAFFSSFVKTLGFTLAKVELGVWHRYLVAAHGEKEGQRLFAPFEQEFKKCVRFVRDITGSKLLISHRPWLEESIKLRSPYIHILNLLQILAMREHDEKLLKETLVGIACGMLTTG